MSDKPKIVQIATLPESDGEYATLYALYDDGQIAACTRSGWNWVKLPEHHQAEETTG